MAYVIIEDFRAGLDRRKMDAASTQGSLQQCSNAHITRGGEIEKRRAFVSKYSLPPGQTFGLAAANGVLYIFGSASSPAVPTGVTYQRLVNGGGSAMNGLIKTEFFDGKVFAVASYASSEVLHFYDGTQVAHFTGGSGAAVAGKQLTSMFTFGSKLYGIAGSVLFFSNIDAPSDWIDTGISPHLGAGFINMANQSAGSESLTALGKYQGLMAVFARRNTQIWSLDVDDANNTQRQVMANIGTFAPRSVVSFGESDLFFLADTGVRSLRAHTATNRAGVTDVGTPIDEELNAYLKTLTIAQRAAAVAAIDPVDGRYILAVGTRCYVFSYYTDGQISAWSRYDLPFSISDLVSDDGKLWARAGDAVYLLGGDNGDTFDSAAVTIETPYIDGRQIATFKQFFGFDIVCQGEWIVSINSDPSQPNEWNEIARVTGTSVADPAIGFDAHSSIIKLKLESVGSTAARVSKLIVHYKSAEAG
jgi:hypothetical protein